MGTRNIAVYTSQYKIFNTLIRAPSHRLQLFGAFQIRNLGLRGQLTLNPADSSLKSYAMLRLYDP